MASEQMLQKTQQTKPKQFEEAVVEYDIEGKIRRVLVSQSPIDTFDRTFFQDVLIGLALFFAAVGCVAVRVPVAGQPWSLLVGPAVGLVLALIHRPER